MAGTKWTKAQKEAIFALGVELVKDDGAVPVREIRRRLAEQDESPLEKAVEIPERTVAYYVQKFKAERGDFRDHVPPGGVGKAAEVVRQRLVAMYSRETTLLETRAKQGKMRVEDVKKGREIEKLMAQVKREEEREGRTRSSPQRIAQESRDAPRKSVINKLAADLERAERQPEAQPEAKPEAETVVGA